MARFTSLPRSWLLLLAIVFAAVTTFYSAIWMYYVRWEPKAQIGIGTQYSRLTRSLTVTGVPEGSAAEQAGLRPADHIVAINGRPLDNFNPYYDAVYRGQPGDVVELTVERPGVAAPIVLQTVLQPRPVSEEELPPAQTVAIELILSYPVLFLVVGLGVLFLRLEDRNAWLLALLFGTFIAGAPLLQMEGAIHPALRGFALAYKVTFTGLFAAIFYYFFAVFPVPSPIDRRLPWLKRVLLLAAAAVVLPLGLWGLLAGSSQPLQMFADQVGEKLIFPLVIGYIFGALGLGLVSLVWNGLRAPTAEARRKIRVIVWGTVVGFTPGLLLNAAAVYAKKDPYDEFPFWVWAPTVMASFLLPLSFAYAVVKHRVLEIPQLLRLGLQYALARRVLVSLVPVLAAILVADLLLHGDKPLMEVVQARGWIYALLGGLAVVAHTQREKWLGALDRRFFRERYDAQRLLREVVEEVRRAGSFEQVAPRVVAHTEAALHPEFAALLVREPAEANYRSLASAPAGQAPPPLPAESKLMGLVRLLGKPLEVPQTESGWVQQQLPREETDFLRQARIELLVPVAIVPERTEALLVVGPKRSEEPYTREDQDLLVAVATSLAILLEKPAAPPAPPKDVFEECPQCGTCYDTGVSRCLQDRTTLTSVRLPRLLADRYRLERRLGRGGMGTVYEATDTALERRVAAKVIRDELVGSAEAAERFRREARAAAAFAHPNVVTVHDFGVAADTRAFLVMELLQGTPLREELQQEKRLPARRTVEILRGVCAAVEAAHHRQMIHRDLKPENVFLVRGEPGEIPKVLDFGIAKFLPTASESTVDTGTGLLVGTLYYMAPEQLRGGSADPHWDLWALAVMAYEMLTGERPFAGATPPEWQSAVLAGQFTSLTTHLPSAPARWQEFFQRALALEPERRPASARQFLSQLERSLA
ncbi:protein kinase [Acidobacteriia bacterium AH_259_A11_L15]|nr:protein kinase [Acidobacteriia bacterium AH_259_A11_L15]